MGLTTYVGAGRDADWAAGGDGTRTHNCHVGGCIGDKSVREVNDETDGFVKMLVEEKSDKVLGVHMIGPYAGTMIAEMVLAMEFGASSEDIARTCHAHPTHTEAIKEAALSVAKRPIHY